MKIIDCRTAKDATLGERVQHPNAQAAQDAVPTRLKQDRGGFDETDGAGHPLQRGSLTSAFLTHRALLPCFLQLLLLP